jgi:Protein of unknown function (DUF2934)
MAIRRPPDDSTRNPATTPSTKRARARTTPVAGQTSGASARDVAVSDETRRSMISEAAYLRAEQRGFTAGYELEDWLLAEREVDVLLSANRGAAPQ